MIQLCGNIRERARSFRLDNLSSIIKSFPILHAGGFSHFQPDLIFEYSKDAKSVCVLSPELRKGKANNIEVG